MCAAAEPARRCGPSVYRDGMTRDEFIAAHVRVCGCSQAKKYDRTKPAGTMHTAEYTRRKCAKKLWRYRLARGPSAETPRAVVMRAIGRGWATTGELLAAVGNLWPASKRPEKNLYMLLLQMVRAGLATHETVTKPPDPADPPRPFPGRLTTTGRAVLPPGVPDATEPQVAARWSLTAAGVAALSAGA